MHFANINPLSGGPGFSTPSFKGSPNACARSEHPALVIKALGGSPVSRDSSISAGCVGTYRLGAHDVARVGYGAMQLHRCTDTPAVALALLRRAIDLGVNHLDTAQFYGDGFVNEIIGEMLREAPQIVVATKVGAEPNPGGKIPIRPAQRPEQLRVGVEDNLRRLDVMPGLTAEGDQVVDIPGTVSFSHLEENVAAASISFDEETLAELDANYTKTVQVTDGDDT